MSSKAKDDDLAPAEYPYLWSSKSEISLDDFLKKVRGVLIGMLFAQILMSFGLQYKPSMVQDDGTKPVGPVVMSICTGSNKSSSGFGYAAAQKRRRLRLQRRYPTPSTKQENYVSLFL